MRPGFDGAEGIWVASQFRGILKSIRLDFEKICWSKTSNSQTYAKREQGNWPRGHDRLEKETLGLRGIRQNLIKTAAR